MQVTDLSPSTDWSAALEGVDTVVHCAARVHVMSDSSADPLAAFRLVNLEGTMRLATQAQRAGVRRLVFVSSIKVNGESTQPGQPFTADQQCAPRDPYGMSKHEAEQALRKLASDTDMEVAIIRPPLVYGPGVKANFLSMMRWLDRGIPLPFGALGNRRSLIAVDNLASLITRCALHPAAANETFLASDGDDLSTTQLLRRLAAALGARARLLPVPAKWIERGATLSGLSPLAQRLCGSLQVDVTKTRSVLDWAPIISVEEGLQRTARAFLADKARRALQ